MQLASFFFPTVFASAALACVAPVHAAPPAESATPSPSPPPGHGYGPPPPPGSSAALTTPLPPTPSQPGSASAPPYPISATGSEPSSPSYTPPYGEGCLTDAQSDYIVSQFFTMLSSVDRNVTVSIGEALLADSYTEQSDSINSLSGNHPLGSTSFTNKTEYLASIGAAKPLGGLSTIFSFHSCDKIAWYWVGTHIGRGLRQVQGINLLSTSGGQVTANHVEFNSVAWGYDIFSPAVNLTAPP